MMEYRIEEVDIDKIKDDERFRISTERSAEDIIRSVKEEGLLTPPLLAFKDSFIVVSGFRRIDACRKTGLKKIKARIAENFDEFELLKCAVIENTTQRELNIIEQSTAVTKLKPFLEKEKFLKEASRIAGIPRNPKLFEKLEKISALSSVIKKYMVDDSIPLATALELQKLENSTAERIAEIFNRLKVSLNIQREILTNLTESAKREKTSIELVLCAEEVVKILENEDKNRNEKAKELREYLKKRRYPSITEAFENYKDKVGSLNLSGIKLIHPPDFEGTDYGISLFFSSTEELKKKSEELNRLCSNPAMEEILKRES